MCGLSCLEIVHCVPRMHARTASFGNGACVCVYDYICSELRRERGCAKCTDRYANTILWVCERAHLCMFSRVPLKECHRLHIHLCAVIILKMSRWKSASLTTGRRTGVFLARGGHPFRTSCQSLWRMWSSVPHPSIQWRWVHWDEGTYSIPTMLIRDVTLRGKNKSGDPFTFQSFFPRRHLAV